MSQPAALQTHIASLGLEQAHGLLHDLRKPIAAIRAFGELLVDGISGPIGAEQADHVGTMLDNARRLDERLTGLFELFECGCGPLALHSAASDFDAFVDGVLDELRPRLEANGVVLAVVRPPRLGRVQADVSRLRRVLVRLLAEIGRGVLEGHTLDVTLEGTADAVRLELTPVTGRPTPDPGRPLLDETGVELHVCRALVAAHGGRMHTRPHTGGVERLCLELPREPEQALGSTA